MLSKEKKMVNLFEQKENKDGQILDKEEAKNKYLEIISFNYESEEEITSAVYLCY